MMVRFVYVKVWSPDGDKMVLFFFVGVDSKVGFLLGGARNLKKKVYRFQSLRRLTDSIDFM